MDTARDHFHPHNQRYGFFLLGSIHDGIGNSDGVSFIKTVCVRNQRGDNCCVSDSSDIFG